MDLEAQKRRKFKRGKWCTLISFGLLYTMVYSGRFGLNYNLENLSQDIMMSETIKDSISNSIYIAYALGSLINGSLIDHFRNPRQMIIIGVSLSIISNLFIPMSFNWQELLVLSLINGYFQSMIWVGGIALVAYWWRSNERAIGGGIANFFSGLSHVLAFFLPTVIIIPSLQQGWVNNIVSPLIFMFIFLFLFVAISHNSPQDIGCENYKEEQLMNTREMILETKIRIEKRNPLSFFLKEKRMWCWCAIAFFSSLCRYGLLLWIPKYYEANSLIGKMSASTTNLLLPLGMAFGTLILSFIAGKHFQKNKGIIVVLCAACTGTLITIFPMMLSSRIAMIGIFGTGFFLYGINGILWIYAMDIGGRVYPATVAGVLNCCAYIGAYFEGNIFSFVLDSTGSWMSIFVLMEVFCIAMAGFAILVSEKDTIVEEGLNGESY